MEVGKRRHQNKSKNWIKERYWRNTDIKFQYISGSVENSKQYDSSNEIVLESQGIREHVCDILEGGDIAFKKRERKYNLK